MESVDRRRQRCSADSVMGPRAGVLEATVCYRSIRVRKLSYADVKGDQKA